MAGLGRVLDAIAPWLLELGSWIFGALIALDLLIVGALLTVGPVDPAVLVATAALALALPPNVAGFVMLRLANDLRRVALEKVAAAAFQEVGFSLEGEPTPPEVAAEADPRRTRQVLGYSYAMLAIGLLLTMIGLAASFWHMAWWIGVAFAIMAVLSQALLVRGLALGGQGRQWRGTGRADGETSS